MVAGFDKILCKECGKKEMHSILEGNRGEDWKITVCHVCKKVCIEGLKKPE